MVHDLLRRDGDRLTNEPPPGEAGGSATAPGSGSGAAVAPGSAGAWGGAGSVAGGAGSAGSAGSAAGGAGSTSPSARAGAADSDPAAVTAESAAAAARGSIVGLAAPGEGGGSIQPIAAPARMGARQEYLPGSANPGLYVVMSHSGFLDWVGIPLGLGVASDAAFFRHHQIEGMIAVVNREITRLLERDAILIPTRRGQTYTLEGRDLTTGFRFFEGTFDPPAPGEITVHPPDVFGDEEPPVPVSGSPVRFFVLTAAGGSHELAVGLSYSFAAGSLTVTALPGAAAAEAQVRLVGLDDGADRTLAAAADGSFAFSEPAAAGRRYILALGAEVGVNQPLEVSFDEGLATSLAGISVRDAAGRNVAPEIAFAGDTATVRITPLGGWRAGQTYTLRLGPELADAAGNPWGETLAVEFTVGQSTVLDTLNLAEVRDVARLGSWLFIAAGADGLAVVDASDPDALRHVAVDGAGAGVTFPFPLADRAAAVTIDPHARVLVAGGGVTGFGQLKIFDPLAFDPVAVGQNPTDPAVLYAAFRGSTIVSDRLGGSGGGTSLPEGTPRRVTVLSDDQIDRWRLGEEPPPAGITLEPATPPAGGGSYSLTVSGAGMTAGLPLTLRDLDRGSFRRVDAGAGGAWSITLTATAADRLELLRNRQSLAYLATLGVGIEVVDVNAFYDEAGGQESDVIGIYTGYQDPNLTLCNQPVSDLGAALIDLGTLFDAADPHPLTLVGLIGFRGVGMFESDPVDVGEVSFYNEACLEIGGSNRVSGMAVAEDYPFDFNGNGVFEAEEYRDYLVVTHLSAGVLILDATNRDELELVGWVRLPGQSGEVAVDANRRFLYVSGLGGGLYVIEFDEVPSTATHDANSDGLDDRLLEVIPLDGNTNSATLIAPELGIAFAGGLDRGLTAIGVAAPWLVVLGPDGEGGWVPVGRLAPDGSPTTMVDGRPLPAVFRVMVALPGVLGAEIRLDVVSLGAGGLPMPGDDHPDAPPPSLTGAEGLLLRRLADQPWQEGYQIYVSGPVVTFADLRAVREYAESADEAELCARCDSEAEGAPAGARELLSGNSIAIRFPATLRPALAGIYPASVLDRAEVAIESIPWKKSPAVRQEPVLNPSLGTGDVAPGTLLHSGEYTHTVTDLMVRGRGIDIAFTRTYRNRTVGSGPLGPGWELNYWLSLRELPGGDVEYYDGTGRRETFVREGGGYRSPTGVFAELSRTPAGWVLLDAQRNLQRFDRWGRLVSIADAVKDSADTGNQLTFRYNLAGHLVEVIDDLDRSYELAYDADGRLASITDFTGRTVSYGYDSDGRLESVTSPAVTIGESTFPSGLTTTYAYATVPAGSDLATTLNLRDNLVAITDPRGVTWLELDYTDADADGRADELTGQTWGGDPLAIAYDFTARTATVTNRRGQTATYEHTAAGQLARFTDATAADWEWEHDAEGLVTREELPGDRTTEFSYDTAGNRRARGNLLSVVVTPDGRGANGSPATLTTSIEYHARTHRPTQVTDPRGAVTAIERTPSGLPLRITRAQGAPEQSVTQIAYNAFGQPTRVTNPNGHATDFLYATSGPAAGYLEREIVNPAGLALTTRYETDALGRPTAVIDPRGVRLEAAYNEVDWLVEQTAAATPAQDGSGAPALGYRTIYRHDGNGNLIEERLPLGATGAESTVVVREYGTLNELLREEREIAPGGERAVWQYAYDAALNLVRVTDPEQHVEEIDYDPRGLPIEIRRGLGAGALAAPIVERPWFDPDRQLGRVTDARGYVWLTERDGYGRVAAQFDPLGNARRTAYDAGGDPSAIEARDAENAPLARTELEHDRLGRLTLRRERLWQFGSVDPSLPTTAAAALAAETRFEYDPASNLVRTVDPLGRQTQFEHDAAERLAAREDAAGNRLEWTLDAAGNPIQERSVETLPGGGGDPVTVATGRAFDALGRPAEEVDAFGNRTHLHHDARGNLLRVIDPEGFFTEHGYDGLDQRVSTVRPGGIAETFVYDQASRLTAYRDALGHQTSYAWDAADRLTAVTYPDATTYGYELDPAGNVERWTDPLGTVVDQTFDAAGRLRLRVIAPGAGVVGVTSEGYDYDGLSRLTRAVSGAIVTDLAYDSLGRVLGDTTAGKTVRSEHDPVGNDTRLVYPSGLELVRGFDALDRLAVVGTPSAPESILTLAYRGPGRRAAATFGGGVAAAWSYDPSGRAITERYATAAGDPVLAETLSWTPRGLKGAVGRAELPGAGMRFGYDGAGQLVRAASGPVPAGAVPNNSTPAAAVEQEGYRFAYDPTQALVESSAAHAGIDSLTLMPPDASGRNRPAQLLGAQSAALSWNAAGQLTQKRDLTFEYDYRGRLVRARRQGAEIALYEYDAFNRKIYRTVEGVERQTVWDGLRPVEDYQAGELLSRRTYGPGLDEIVRMEIDLDGDGALEQSYVPLYDHSGNLAVLTGALGLPIERYTYAPFGPERIEVDSVAPQVTQARVIDQEIHIEWSDGLTEEVLLRSLSEGAIVITADGELLLPSGLPLRWEPGGDSQATAEAAGTSGAAAPLAAGAPSSTSAASGSGDFTASLPVLDGPLAGRRLVIAFTEPPTAGAAIVVTVHPEAVADAFLNRPAAPWTHSFAWPAADTVLTDTEPPRVERVAVVDGELEILFSEPPDPATAQAAILLDGQPVTWTATGDGYGLVAATPLATGTHQLDIGTGLADLAGNFLNTPLPLTLDLTAVLSLLAHEALNARLTDASAVGNAYGFHGLELDTATGLIYARNRWFDAELSRFIGPDPLGYIDGPNLYQYALNNPINYSDPLGLDTCPDCRVYAHPPPPELVAANERSARCAVLMAQAGNQRLLSLPQSLQQASEAALLLPSGVAKWGLDCISYSGACFERIKEAIEEAPESLRQSWIAFENQSPDQACVAWGEALHDTTLIVAAGAPELGPGRGTMVLQGTESGAVATVPRGLSDDILRLTERNLTSSGDTILGSYPGYINKASARGASYFDIGDAWKGLNDAERWAANRYFLDTVANRGDRILLSTPKSGIQPNTWLAREVEYLTQDRGYVWVNQWSLRPGG